MYGYDREHTALYYNAAKKGTEIFTEEYLNKYVFSTALHEDYLRAVGGEETFKKLKAWNTSTEAWMELYA
jgi:glutaconate CoA-transferase subunit A